MPFLIFHGHSIAVFNANTQALFLENADRILYTSTAISTGLFHDKYLFINLQDRHNGV